MTVANEALKIWGVNLEVLIFRPNIHAAVPDEYSWGKANKALDDGTDEPGLPYAWERCLIFFILSSCVSSG